MDVNFYIEICTAEIYGLENLGVNNGTRHVQYRKDKHIFRDKLVVRLAVQKVYPFFITVICIGMCNTNPQKVDQALPFY